jgi:uncharacterized protein YndB with AHSA1/START domain
MSTFTVEQTYAAPRQMVWAAWTEAAALATWLAMKANIRLVEGGAFELFWEPEHPERNSTLGCKLLGLVPGEQLTFSWKGPVDFADLMNVEPPPTSVKVTLRGGAAETTVKLEHRGWGDGPRWLEARAWQEKAWRMALAELSSYLRR